MPRLSAACFTGDALVTWPRPLGRSGWLTTVQTSCPARALASSVGTAKPGVPRKTNRIGYLARPSEKTTKHKFLCVSARNACLSSLFTRLRPLARFYQPLDLALDQIAFQRADVADVQLPHQVSDFVLECPRQQIFAGHLKMFAGGILGAHGSFLGAPALFAESGNAEASLFG